MFGFAHRQSACVQPEKVGSHCGAWSFSGCSSPRARVMCSHVCLQLYPYIQRLVVDFIRSRFDLVGQYQQQTTPCAVIPTCPSAAVSAATTSHAGCCSRTTGKSQWQSDCARHLKCTAAKRAVCPRSFSRCAHAAFKSYEPYLIILQASPPKARSASFETC